MVIEPQNAVLRFPARIDGSGRLTIANSLLAWPSGTSETGLPKCCASILDRRSHLRQDERGVVRRDVASGPYACRGAFIHRQYNCSSAN
jgi:hypothetical protein